MRLHQSATPFVRRQSSTRGRAGNFFTQAMFLLLLLMGCAWSQDVKAAAAFAVYCNLATNAPTVQNGGAGTTLTFTYQVVDAGNCNPATGLGTHDNIVITSDSSGGATITAGNPYIGTENPSVPFTVQLGPTGGGQVVIHVRCQLNCDPSGSSDLTYTANVNPVCNLATNNPLTQSGAPGASLNYTFQIVDQGGCTTAAATSGLINIAADTTGGATITAPVGGYTGPANAAAPFTVQLGPNPGTVRIRVSCQTNCGATDTLFYDATAVATPKMSLVKGLSSYTDPDKSGNVSPGDVLSYTITATNTGNVTLNSVTLSDPAITYTSGTVCNSVAVNGTCVLTGTYTVTAADAATGSVSNTASAFSKQTAAQNSNTVNTPVFASPSMTVVKQLTGNTDPAGLGTVMEGDTLTYTVTATNTGGGTLTNVQVIDRLTNPSIQNCASVAVNGTCVLSGTYTVTLTDVRNGFISNTGTGSADQPSATGSSSLRTRVLPTPKLGVTKVLTHVHHVHGTAGIVPGDVLTYTVTATNNGNVTLGAVTVDDPITTPNTLTCANLAVGASCTLNGIYTVTAADATAGSISNTGTGSSPQLRLPVTATLNTPVSGTPSMSVTKAITANTDPTGAVNVGDVLTYTVTATNNGQVPLTNVVVDDPLTNPATITCTTLAIGAKCVLNGNYTVTATDAARGAITNTGSATSTELTTPITARLYTNVNRFTPGMSVTKALTHIANAGPTGGAVQGSVLTYTVTATNTGTAILGNVVVSDPITSPGSTTCATVAPNGTCVLTADYTVTAGDVTAGSVSNTGAATANQFPTPVPSNTVNTPVGSTIAMTVAKVLVGSSGGTAPIIPGDVLTYRVTATNTGNVTLATVTVNDPLTAPGTATCSNVAPSGTCVLSGTYTVTTADATNGAIVNTGNATAGTQISTPVPSNTVSTPVVPITHSIAIVSGNGQTGAPNAALANPLVVSVLNNGNPATGVTVNWAVTAGTATLGSATSTVAANGQSSNTLTLGATAGPVTVTTTRADDTTQSVTFTATINAPSLTIVSGNNQVGIVDASSVHPLVVNLNDGAGHGLPNQTVNWQVVSGAATVIAPTSLTDANGNAQMNFTYGSSTGAIVIGASVGGASVSFNATAESYVISITGGNNQTGAPGKPLPQMLVVNVSYPSNVTTLVARPGAHTQFAAGGGASGVAVQWIAVSGGGSFQTNSTTTDSSGSTTNVYTLGSSTGLNQMQVVVPGGNTVTFTANSSAPTAVAMALVSGNSQNLAPNTDSQPLVVQLTSNGNPLPNVTVNWTANNATLATPTSVTDANGRTSNVAMITHVGPATVTASSVSPAAGPIVFGINGGLSFIGGLTPLQGQIAGALDNACTALAALATLTPAQQDLLNQCNALAGNPSQAPGALNQMFADSAYLETSAAMLISTTQFDNIKARIAALRSGTGGDHFGGLAFASPNGSLPIGSLGLSAFNNAAGADKDKQEAGAGFDRWGFFLSGTFNHGSSDPRQSLPGYGFNTNGLTAGVDYRFSDKFIAGVSAGFAKYRAGLDGSAGGMNTSGWSLSAYATLFQKDNWYVDGVFTWGSNSYNLSRSIIYTITGPGGTTTVSQNATGKDSGNTLAAALTVGRDFNKGPWSFGPYFRGTWTRVNFDGYQEVTQPGPGNGLGMSVKTDTLQSTATVLGAKVNYASSQSWGVMMPHAELEWQHEFRTSPDAVTARFLQDPTQTPIYANGFPIDSDFFRLGLGVSFVFPRGRSGFVYYEKTLGRTGITMDSIALGLRIEF